MIVASGPAALQQFGARVEFIDGEGAAAVVPVPDHHAARSGVESAGDGGVHFSGKQASRLLEAPLAGRNLFIPTVHAADTFHVGNDADARPGRLHRECS